MKILVEYIKSLKEEIRQLQKRNKDLEEHIDSLTHIYDMLVNQVKGIKKEK